MVNGLSELLVRTELSFGRGRGRGGTTGGGRDAEALGAVAALCSLVKAEGDEASTHDAVSRVATDGKHRSSIALAWGTGWLVLSGCARLVPG